MDGLKVIAVADREPSTGIASEPNPLTFVVLAMGDDWQKNPKETVLVYKSIKGANSFELQNNTEVEIRGETTVDIIFTIGNETRKQYLMVPIDPTDFQALYKADNERMGMSVSDKLTNTNPTQAMFDTFKINTAVVMCVKVFVQ